MLPTKFGVNWPFGSGDKRKIDFQDGGHLGFPIVTILAIFDLEVTTMLPTKFRVNWPFRSGEEAKNRFFKMATMAAILDLRSAGFVATFDLQVTPMLPTNFRVNWPFSSGEEAKNRYQDGGHGGHLGFPIGMILAIFDL